MGEKHCGGGGGGFFFFHPLNGGPKIPCFSLFSSSPLLHLSRVELTVIKTSSITELTASSGDPGPCEKPWGISATAPRRERGGGIGRGCRGKKKKNEGENEREERQFIMRARCVPPPFPLFEVVSEDWWSEERWRGRGLSENAVAPGLRVLFLSVTAQSFRSLFFFFFWLTTKDFLVTVCKILR